MSRRVRPPAWPTRRRPAALGPEAEVEATSAGVRAVVGAPMPAPMVDPAALPAGPLTARFAALLPLAAAQRGQRRAAPEDDDVVEPFGGDQALYRRAFDELRPAVDQIARVVRG